MRANRQLRAGHNREPHILPNQFACLFVCHFKCAPFKRSFTDKIGIYHYIHYYGWRVFVVPVIACCFVCNTLCNGIGARVHLSKIQIEIDFAQNFNDHISNRNSSIPICDFDRIFICEQNIIQNELQDL